MPKPSHFRVVNVCGFCPHYAKRHIYKEDVFSHIEEICTFHNFVIYKSYSKNDSVANQTVCEDYGKKLTNVLGRSDFV